LIQLREGMRDFFAENHIIRDECLSKAKFPRCGRYLVLLKTQLVVKVESSLVRQKASQHDLIYRWDIPSHSIEKAHQQSAKASPVRLVSAEVQSRASEGESPPLEMRLQMYLVAVYHRLTLLPGRHERCEADKRTLVAFDKDIPEVWRLHLDHLLPRMPASARGFIVVFARLGYEIEACLKVLLVQIPGRPEIEAVSFPCPRMGPCSDPRQCSWCTAQKLVGTLPLRTG